MKLLLATGNPGKACEIRMICGGTSIEVFTAPIWLGEIETGSTYLENARLKAASAVRLSGVPVLAEDAGLEVDGLRGLPGHRSARFAGATATDRDNNAKLIALLSGLPEQDLTARFRAVAVVMFPSGREVVGEGTMEGRMVTDPRGSGGFGYDPLFVPQGMDRTGAELSPEEKNAISHRSQAVRAVLDALQARS